VRVAVIQKPMEIGGRRAERLLGLKIKQPTVFWMGTPVLTAIGHDGGGLYLSYVPINTPSANT
jgi:hypothetical protein